MLILRKFQKYMEGREKALPASLVLSGLSAITGIVPYILIWFIIREFLVHYPAPSYEAINTYAWLSVGMAILSIILYFVALSLSHLAAFRVEKNMRKMAMEKIIRMPLGFFNNKTSGRIRKIVDDNAGITHGFLAHQLPDLAATILTPIITLILVFVFDWRLGLACFIPILISMLLMQTMMTEKGKQRLREYMSSLEDMNNEAVEYVRGIPVVKVFQQTIYSFKNFHQSIIRYKDLVSGYAKMWEKPMSLYIVIINGFSFFLVPVAVLIINNNGDAAVTILNLFLYVLITPVLSQSIMRSMYLNQAFEQAGEAVKRVEHLTDEPLLPVSVKGDAIKQKNIMFQNVSFSYPGSGENAIDQISFEIPEGTTTALVGASGSGKTTIARLIPRFWDVDQGSVSIGGINVKDIEQNELMSHISFVFQNTRLFKTTLKENIRYGQPKASTAQIERAIDLAQCREIINGLPNGLQTKIGVNGTYLSGGEQQRMILARAMLKDAPVVILDEATAFADPENEHLIQQAFKEMTANKTVLMIAHRLSSIVGADQILVLDQGKIIERGTHAFLVELGGMYSEMWKEFHESINWTFKGGDNHA